MARDAYIWGATALIGGAAGALDAHAYAEIQDGDPCITPVKGDKVYHHIFDSSSSAAESSPDVIAPDDVGENPGRWILQEPSPATVAANTAKNTNVPIATDPIWTAAGELVIGTGANTAHRLAAGAITKMLVGGGAADPVWTEATGSGAPVRATSPTLVTPALGTPASGDLSNCTNAGGIVTTSVEDEAEIALDTGKTGRGWAMAGDNEEYINFRFTAAGVVAIISNSANAINTDTDGFLCVYDAGAGIAIKNRLGATKVIRYIVNYS